MNYDILAVAARLAAVETMWIMAIFLTVVFMVVLWTYLNHQIENWQFRKDLRWMVASIRCGSDWKCWS
jgi:hypothetical protein